MLCLISNLFCESSFIKLTALLLALVPIQNNGFSTLKKFFVYDVIANAEYISGFGSL